MTDYKSGADPRGEAGRRLNGQDGPWPFELEHLVFDLTYKEDWGFFLFDGYIRGQDCEGLTLVIRVTGPCAYTPSRLRTVDHLFAVPPAAYNRQSWQRWLFDRVADVERHELMEFFTIDGEKPYAPNHGPGHDPYVVRELTTEVDRRTSFRGEVKPDGDGT